MTKRKNVLISEILHLAADKYLYACAGEYYHTDGSCQYTCHAIKNAGYNLCKHTNVDFDFELRDRIKHGLLNLGLKTNKNTGSAFGKLEKKKYGGPSKESQEARYFWLKWCALMAEEQGV